MSTPNRREPLQRDARSLVRLRAANYSHIARTSEAVYLTLVQYANGHSRGAIFPNSPVRVRRLLFPDRGNLVGIVHRDDAHVLVALVFLQAHAKCSGQPDPYRYCVSCGCAFVLRVIRQASSPFTTECRANLRETTNRALASRWQQSSFQRRARRFVPSAPATEPQTRQQERLYKDPGSQSKKSDDRERRLAHLRSVQVAVNKTEQR